MTVVEEKHRHRAEIKVNINNNVFFSEAESPNLRQSVEQVIQRLQRQIKRHKDRFRRRTVNKEELVSMGREASLPAEEAEEMSLESDTRGTIEEMTLSEAVRRVQAGTASILFRDLSSGRTKVVQRQGNGRIDVKEMGPEGRE